jgi:hypothetical protein
MQFLAVFANDFFPGLSEQLDDMGLKQLFHGYLKLMVFSHMHVKGNKDLGNFIISPSVVRDPMFNYSKIAKREFFQYPILAFLLVWFCTDTKARAFFNMKNKYKNNGKDTDRMKEELY